MKGDYKFLVIEMIKNVKELKVILEQNINESDFVVITPHRNPDCDAIAAALATQIIASKLGKESVIVVNEDKAFIERAAASIISELPESINIVNSENLKKILKKKKNPVLLYVDNNKKELNPLDYASEFERIVIIDHHDAGETTLETPNIYINLKSSSACEILYLLLDEFKIKLTSKEVLDSKIPLANYMLAGINLDTSKYKKNTTSQTMKVVSSLLSKGADINYVNELFKNDFDSYKIVLDLVGKAQLKIYNIATAFNEQDPSYIYDKVALAQAADFLMDCQKMDAAFALGLISPDSIYISGRSNGVINIGNILKEFGGGGNVCAGAAQINDSNDVKEMKLRLDSVLSHNYYKPLEIQDKN